MSSNPWGQPPRRENGVDISSYAHSCLDFTSRSVGHPTCVPARRQRALSTHLTRHSSRRSRREKLTRLRTLVEQPRCWRCLRVSYDGKGEGVI
ncbi:hypothetical protein SUGI_0311530 [Cryptomeria japonica]|nr:hypothetical protein SUGI_0311530 [Cryptomeria japonica]